MKLIEHYLSIQGEGLRSGQLAYFVRFARCNLRCSWCDSSYTFGPGKEFPFAKIAAAIRLSKTRFVCLTGGEPLLHREDCLKLIRTFPKIHFDIETGGSLDIRPYLKPNVSVIMDWKLKSSGMGHKMNAANLNVLRPKNDLIKLVTDFSRAEIAEMQSLIRRTGRDQVPVSIQPIHQPIQRARMNGVEKTAQKLANWAIRLKNPRVRVNLQLHKILWPARRRGV